ncbi:hypothetical protein MHJ94_10735 [Chryseobacterium taklimakanense]|uniref:hypothetical protein n=1 Tax=Chryseobacterium taklimakanense TaxID=536441 RepID=UPI001EF50801|nr:hypothetical protein [Chryseobacterium taklimakanense]MCG7281766.1 hypothetical protein [Chryseobacterium taklimakanense]
MRIERFTESRRIPAIYHKIADLPAGVAIRTKDFPNGGHIPEATPLYVGNDGLYNAALSAKVVETAAADAVTYTVEKGSLLKVGDKLQKTKTVSVNITGIDTTDPNKDVITVDATLGAKNAGDVVAQFYTGEPVAITGESVTFRQGDNVWVSAWVIAVVNKNIMPEPLSKPAGVLYV